MGALYTVAINQYDDYLDKLTSGIYRDSEVAETVTVKGAILISLYTLAAMENNTTNMTAILAKLETNYNESITGPSLISGLESEAAQGYDTAVVAGDNTITFDIALSSDDYALFITCYDSDGNAMSYKRHTKTAAGFKIYVPYDGYIDYRAIIV
jgi:hypothetical protein